MRKTLEQKLRACLSLPDKAVPFGCKITERTLHTRTGSEGPQHDPYSYIRRTVTLNGWEFTLHMGLGCWLKINGVRVEPMQGMDYPEWEGELVGIWIAAVGMDPEEFDHYYERLNPYFDDPMGNPSDYI